VLDVLTDLVPVCNAFDEGRSGGGVGVGVGVGVCVSVCEGVEEGGCWFQG
jgi:hypothetical protein